jgi:Xaa-Pro dipeptidase
MATDKLQPYMTPAWSWRNGPDVAPAPPAGLRLAQQLAREAATYGIECVHPGMTEQQVSQQVAGFLADQDAAGVWSITNVGLGENAHICFPTHPPGLLQAKERDVVIVDVHPITSSGFWGDCTRCRVLGNYAEAQQALSELTEIHHKLLALCYPGMTANTLFNYYSQHLSRAGFTLIDALANVGHALTSGAAYSEGFIDIQNTRPMWGAWAIEPFVSRGGIAVKVEDLMWFGREHCEVL